MRHNLKLLLCVVLSISLAREIATAQQVETLVQNLGGRPEALALSPDGSIYCPMPLQSQVVRIERNGTFSVIIPSISLPEGGGFDQLGNYYVSAFTPNRIAKLTPVNVYTPIFASGLHGPTGIIQDVSGDFLYVANYNTNSISKVNLADSSTASFTTSAFINGPDGFAFDDEGNLYLANFNNSKINMISPAGTVTEFVTLPGNGIGYITFSNGSFYVAGLNTNKIYKVTKLGEISTIAGTGAAGYVDGPAETSQFNKPNGIVASVTGDTIFIGDVLNLKIRMLILNSVGINNQNNEISDKFSLEQNYPNPFNPSTKISFSIPERSFASLKVYDLQGKEIAEIVSETLEPGNYYTSFTSRNLSSGVYFYSLKAGNKIETKKMTFLK